MRFKVLACDFDGTLVRAGSSSSSSPTEAGERSHSPSWASPRETAHVRHLRKYVDARVAGSDGFVFRGADGRAAGEARSLRDFRRALATVADGALAHHAARGDFSRWVLDVFSDGELARELRKTEARFRRGELSDLRGPIDQLIVLRYGRDA